MNEKRAKRNRTITLTTDEIALYSNNLLHLNTPAKVKDITNKTIHGDFMDAAKYFPKKFIDLLIIDPPYNLNKTFADKKFKQLSYAKYVDYVESWFCLLLPMLKKTASIYVCCDWKSAQAIFEVLTKHTIIRNRITWQREKGRGAKMNWKNCVEDIWFATLGNDYYFDVDAVKIRRKVFAPYKMNGKPKDWEETADGKFRFTYPSNFWDDISVPYWSMPENTDHPTQKPEKLLAKLILASSREGDFVFDPFLGSGTTSVVAKKLKRKYCGIEFNEEYCVLAEKRLHIAATDNKIQGYADGIFWERNSRI
ncbi:MAG: site-specific DNA-methyltransferase [Prevotellaceae bacterium]|jgi:site-specific DNA-methyltransferase (adenine-specific)|nr:site-specific DNA-methyltransferase [Prevotellaceae bacterium]